MTRILAIAMPTGTPTSTEMAKPRPKLASVWPKEGKTWLNSEFPAPLTIARGDDIE